MNVSMKQVVRTSRDGDEFWNMPEVYVRGNTIKYVRIPDTVLDSLAEEKHAREASVSFFFLKFNRSSSCHYSFSFCNANYSAADSLAVLSDDLMCLASFCSETECAEAEGLAPEAVVGSAAGTTETEIATKTEIKIKMGAVAAHQKDGVTGEVMLFTSTTIIFRGS